MPHDDASLSTANPDLTVVERRVLDRIFQHPLSHNLSWREVLELFRATGAVDHAHNGNVALELGSDHLTFEPAHGKDLSADDVMALRHFLTHAGWTPELLPMKEPPPAALAIAVVIDHADARIYALTVLAGHQSPKETHHILHSVDRKQHDADREEARPADHSYFDAIARNVPGDARIVVVSHGKGQSNEGSHMLGYMEKHHRTLYDRIVRLIVADLPHTSVPQLLQLARDALPSATDAVDAIAD